MSTPWSHVNTATKTTGLGVHMRPNKSHSKLRRGLFSTMWTWLQRKLCPITQCLVDFAIWLVDSDLCLPEGQVTFLQKIFEEIQISEVQCPVTDYACKNFLWDKWEWLSGWYIIVSQNLQLAQAQKSLFSAPWGHVRPCMHWDATGHNKANTLFNTFFLITQQTLCWYLPLNLCR